MKLAPSCTRGANLFSDPCALPGVREEAAREFCHRWLAAWTGNHPELLIRFYAPGAYYSDPARPGGLRGHDEILPYFRKLLAKYPDWTWEPREVFPIERGFVLKWLAAVPTPRGDVTAEGLDLVEVDGEAIARNEVYFDSRVLGP